MKCVILHESSRRIRMRIPRIRMSCRDADLLEYYLRNIACVRDATVDERTGNAVVVFRRQSPDNKAQLFAALQVYDAEDEHVIALVPEETGRKLNREYQQKLVCQVIRHYFCKLFLPPPLCTVRTVCKSIPYVWRALRTLAKGERKVEVLDGIAIAASVLRGDYATASSVMFLLESGEILEAWTRKKTVGDLARSMSLNVQNVWLLTGGQEVQVPLKTVQMGDHIVVRNSEIIPLDGKVVSGEMTVNESIMTGESAPVSKRPDGYVYAGTVVEEGECVIEVTKRTGYGKYDQIVNMIEESEKLKSNTEAKAYRLADSLVPYSFAGFALTYLLTRNLTRALAFLMVDYSCAMKLSMPLAVLSAIREARNYGIAIKGGKFMEAVAEADTIVFDKTGTLTHACPKLVEVVALQDSDPDEMLRIAACLEEHYPHSVANAIVDGAKSRNLKHDELHSKVEYIAAHGISSYIGEKKAVIGSAHFVFEDEKCVFPEDEQWKIEQIPEDFSRIYLAIDGQLRAILCISDPVREEAAHVITELRRLGIRKLCMMTGDNAKTAAAVARKLGIDEFYAEVLPEDKAEFVRKEQLAGRKVIMIGDGVNDSPALSQADVGAAMDAGAAIAREIADITISSDQLMGIVTLRKLSSSLMGRIKSNYNFIIGFNSALIALGLTGIAAPSVSAVLHNGATIAVGVKSMTNLLEE